MNRGYYRSLLGEACVETGRLDDGLSALMETLSAANERKDSDYAAEMHRLKGELLARRIDSNAAEALRCFEPAIETARQ